MHLPLVALAALRREKTKGSDMGGSGSSIGHRGPIVRKGEGMANGGDRRVRRTRESLLQAFNTLVLEGGRGDIRVADIVARADIGRSTFYDHYRSADELHMEALSAPLSILADAVTGSADRERLAWLLAHFWENRTRARDTFAGADRDRVVRLLADQIAERLETAGVRYRLPLPLAALQLAELSLAPVRGWVMALAPADAAQLAESLIAVAAGVREALREDGPEARPAA
jgi:AcrR family transcriptional regulator